MSNAAVNQHKRMAMGQSLAKGGTVRAPNVTPVGAGAKMVPGGTASPLSTARRNNGVPGMCAGGKMKK